MPPGDFIPCLKVFMYVCTSEFMHMHVSICWGQSEDSEGFRSHPLFLCSVFIQKQCLNLEQCNTVATFFSLLPHKIYGEMARKFVIGVS